MPHQQRDKAPLANIQRGGHGLKEDVPKGRVVSLDLILIATGSEVGLTMDAAVEMKAKGHSVRVASRPSTSTFDVQDAEYRESVLPPSVTKRIAIEASHYSY